MEQIQNNHHEDENNEVPKIINPEIPPTPLGKRALMNLCIDTLEAGGEVHGVTPNHISQEGMYNLERAGAKTNPPQY